MTLRGIKRAFLYWWQRRTRGWDDSDIWSLDVTIAKFITPRLKLYRQTYMGHPCELTSEEWATALDKMIAAFEYTADEEAFFGSPKLSEQHEEGLRLFAQYFHGLWD